MKVLALNGSPRQRVSATFRILEALLAGMDSEALARDLFPGGRAAFHAQANRFWKDLMDRHRRPGAEPVALTEEELDAPDGGPSCRTLVAGMTMAFDPSAAAKLDARIEFRLGGADPGTYHLAISRGTCRFADGPAPSAALTIEAPSDVWSAIATGRRDGRAALLDGSYRASGDLALLPRMGALFRPARAAP